MSYVRRSSQRDLNAAIFSVANCMDSSPLCIGSIFLLFFVIEIAYGQYYSVNLIFGTFFLIVGCIILLKRRKEGYKVRDALIERDEVTVEQISRETGVPESRVRRIILLGTAVGQLKGKLLEDTYTVDTEAKWIDSETIRCPHCGKESRVANGRSSVYE